MKKKRKLTILYVLKILKDGTNETHPVSQSVITRTINLLGVKCDRRSIARDIDCLISYGYEIVKIPGGGCYMKNQFLSSTEIDLLVQGIRKLDITVKEKVDLIHKVKRLINIYERD